MHRMIDQTARFLRCPTPLLPNDAIAGEKILSSLEPGGIAFC
jgi:hypothetical protein